MVTKLARLTVNATVIFIVIVTVMVVFAAMVTGAA
jgi:hypothetical protein